MLRLGDDWTFEVDPKRSAITLSPKGLWSLKVVCSDAEVRSAGAREKLAPRLLIEALPFDGDEWRDLIGLEIYQEGAWRGDGDPEASLYVVESGELYETKLRIVGHEETHLNVELEGTCDVFFDDGHDTNVPIRLQAAIPFEGVRFRFRGDGVASRDPERRATEILQGTYTISAFGPPEVMKLKPGVFSALFPPALEAGGEETDLTVSAEVSMLRQSANELLGAFIKQGWLELEENGLKTLVPGFVDAMEMGGRGSERAERVVEWLLEQKEVVDVHCTDEELGAVLDKWW